MRSTSRGWPSTSAFIAAPRARIESRAVIGLRNGRLRAQFRVSH